MCFCFLVPNFYVICDKSVVINVQETAETVWFHFKIVHMTAIRFWSLCILWLFIKYRLPKSNCSHLLSKRFPWTVEITQYFYFFTQKVTFFISTFFFYLSNFFWELLLLKVQIFLVTFTFTQVFILSTLNKSANHTLCRIMYGQSNAISYLRLNGR